jgi:hypothetical protein
MVAALPAEQNTAGSGAERLRFRPVGEAAGPVDWAPWNVWIAHIRGQWCWRRAVFSSWTFANDEEKFVDTSVVRRLVLSGDVMRHYEISCLCWGSMRRVSRRGLSLLALLG